LVSERYSDLGEGEVAYRLVLRNPRRAAEFVGELNSTPGVSQVSFVLHEEQTEV
jgi:hypothetical protein